MLNHSARLLVFHTCPLHPSISVLFCRVVRLAQYCADRFISLSIHLADSHNLSPLPSLRPHFINITHLCCLHAALLHLLQWCRINYPFKHTQTLCVIWIRPGAPHTSQILTGLPRAGQTKKHQREMSHDRTKCALWSLVNRTDSFRTLWSIISKKHKGCSISTCTDNNTAAWTQFKPQIYANMNGNHTFIHMICT